MKEETPLSRFMADFFSSRLAVLGLILLSLVVAIALLAPWISPQNPFDIASLDPIWIEVPVYVGDLERIATDKSAEVGGLAGTPGAVDGNVVASTIVADASAFHPVNNRGAAFPKPSGIQPVKLTITAPNAGLPVSGRGKVITLQSA